MQIEKAFSQNVEIHLPKGNRQESVKLGLYTFEPEKFLLSLSGKIQKLSHRQNELLNF